MQRLIIVVGLVAAAVVLQGCNGKGGKAAADHMVAVTSACDTAVDAKLKLSVDKYNTDSQAYCDTLVLPTDAGKKSICTLKRTMFQPLCGLASRWKLACLNENSATVLNATATEAAVTAYIEGSDTEVADRMVSGFVTQTELCSTQSIQSIKDAVAAPREAVIFATAAPSAASRLYDATAKPQAAEPFFFAMSGFVIVMVVGSVAFGVKRFVRNRMIGTGVAEADQEAQALVEHLGEVE